MRDRIPPMTLDTLKEKNRELYETLNPERFWVNVNDRQKKEEIHY
jgi:hypothetical protein